MEIFRAIRALKRRLAASGELTREEAREVFFAVCLSNLACDTAVLSQLRAAQQFEKVLRAPSVTAVSEQGPDAVVARYATLLVDAFGPVCDSARRDPLILGWAHQIWNEEERARSTWGISRRGETLPQEVSVPAATQLFTDEYMTHFLIGCVLGKQAPEEYELFDPACGVGHFLVEGIRHVYAQTSAPQCVVEFVCERLFGVDIDPRAVELCRIVVWLEAVRYAPEAGERLWHSLQTAIRVAPGECGSLDRRSSEPLLNRTYRCVATNPPYLGRRKLTEEMRAFLDTEYADASADLCAAFLQRCVELVAPGGSLALVTVDKWLRLASYRDLRNGGRVFRGLYEVLTIDLLCELGERAFRREVGLHDGVRILLTVARASAPPENHHVTVLDVSGCADAEEKGAALHDYQSGGLAQCVRSIAQRRLREPLSAKELYLSKLPRTLQHSGRTVRDTAEVVVGLQTNDDRRLVRFHWEVVPDSERWRVHSKGGGYGRWFGLNRYLLDWSTGRPEFERSPRSGMRVESFFERSGWTYTWFANGCIGLRWKEKGWSFGRAAASGFFCDDDRVVAFLNSRFGSLVARQVGGKIQLPEGVVRTLPIPEKLDPIDPHLVSAAVAIKQVLVSHDLTDVTFRPDLRETSEQLLALEAVLLLVEGELEQQAERCVECTGSERDAMQAQLGVPVGWLSCSDVGREVLPCVWSRVPEQFRWLEGQLSSPNGAGKAPSIDEESVVSGLLQRSTKGKGRAFLPCDSRLEAACRGAQIHPLDAYACILRRSAEDVDFARAVHLPYIADQVLVGAADSLGHRWWALGSRVAHTEPREFIPLGEALRNIQERLSARQPRFGPFCVEDILGAQLPIWIRDRFAGWQKSRMLQKPIVTIDRERFSGVGGFKHAWHEGVTRLTA